MIQAGVKEPTLYLRVTWAEFWEVQRLAAECNSGRVDRVYFQVGERAVFDHDRWASGLCEIVGANAVLSMIGREVEIRAMTTPFWNRLTERTDWITN